MVQVRYSELKNLLEKYAVILKVVSESSNRSAYSAPN